MANEQRMSSRPWWFGGAPEPIGLFDGIEQDLHTAAVVAAVAPAVEADRAAREEIRRSEALERADQIRAERERQSDTTELAAALADPTDYPASWHRRDAETAGRALLFGASVSAPVETINEKEI